MLCRFLLRMRFGCGRDRLTFHHSLCHRCQATRRTKSAALVTLADATGLVLAELHLGKLEMRRSAVRQVVRLGFEPVCIGLSIGHMSFMFELSRGIACTYYTYVHDQKSEQN